MGLYVQSLENIPEVKIHKEYFIYLLDYGWNEPLSETLMKNYENMAKIAAENKAVVIFAIVGVFHQQLTIKNLSIKSS